mgnify:FL=1
MKQISVCLYGKQNPTVFEDVEDYFENRKALVIIQEEMYYTTITKIFKQSLQMYKVIDKR